MGAVLDNSNAPEIPDQVTENKTKVQLRDRSTLRKPKKLDDYEIDSENIFYCSAYEDEPLTYEQAINCIDANAMEEEMQSLEKNQVWELVEAPKNSSIMENKWGYKLKTDSNGNIQKHKARLVAKGFSQCKGMDFHESFSPVVRFDSIRVLLTMILQESLILKQFDVRTTFLNGDIEEVVHMKQPTRYEDGTTKLCKLLKSLYGPRQSSRCWNQKSKQFLLTYGLIQSKADPCIYMLINQNKIVLLVNILITDWQLE